MRYQSVFKVLLPLIFGLALVAAGMGLFDQAPGHSYALANFRGEHVTINGHGLYYWDTLSAAAQMQTYDLITFVVGVPLLALGAWLAFRGSLRGQLLLTGTLGFFLYTYLSMCMLAAYNGLFLVYVTLFGLSLYAFALSLMAVDVAALPAHFAARFPRGWVAGLLFLVGGFLLAAWLGRLVPELLHPQTPAALENATTRVIQAMDLSLVAPLAIVAGVLLLRRQPWGYLLASVAVLKGLTLALAVSAMAINMTLAGVPDSLSFMAPFLVLTALNLVAGVVLLRNIREASAKPWADLAGTHSVA
jgi:hypothetical protein